MNINSRTAPVVLVADDEPSMLALVARHVRTLGYEVLEASDGEIAWETAQKSLPDLVVLDVMMPGMSGWEVCRRIRESISLHHTGVIMLTGIGQSLNELTSPLYGADAYLDKPFEFKQLDRMINEVLKGRGHEPVFVEPPPPASVQPSARDYGTDYTGTYGEDGLDDEVSGAHDGASAADLPDLKGGSEEHVDGVERPLPSFDSPIADAFGQDTADRLAASIASLVSIGADGDDEEDAFSSAVTLRPPAPKGQRMDLELPEPIMEPVDYTLPSERHLDADEPETLRPPARKPSAGKKAKAAKSAKTGKAAKSTKTVKEAKELPDDASVKEASKTTVKEVVDKGVEKRTDKTTAKAEKKPAKVVSKKAGTTKAEPSKPAKAEKVSAKKSVATKDAAKGGTKKAAKSAATKSTKATKPTKATKKSTKSSVAEVSKEAKATKVAEATKTPRKCAKSSSKS